MVTTLRMRAKPGMETAHRIYLYLEYMAWKQIRNDHMTHQCKNRY